MTQQLTMKEGDGEEGKDENAHDDEDDGGGRDEREGRAKGEGEDVGDDQVYKPASPVVHRNPSCDCRRPSYGTHSPQRHD